MGHPEQLAFVQLASKGIRGQANFEAIEIGSYDVNGNTRAKFDPSVNWVGVDLVEGPGVDIVNFGHLVDFPNESFDLSISCECFEHDEFWVETFTNMVRMTKQGGVVIFTCASIGRPEHGTKRSQSQLSPGTQAQGLDYYKNLSERDFRQTINFEQVFSKYAFYYNPITFDLYFVGQKKGFFNHEIIVPATRDVKVIKLITTRLHRMIRLPLYIMLRLLPLSIYDGVAFRYWMLLIKLEDVVFRGKGIRLDNR
jgi:SAM-dependent methyltransferase